MPTSASAAAQHRSSDLDSHAHAHVRHELSPFAAKVKLFAQALFLLLTFVALIVEISETNSRISHQDCSSFSTSAEESDAENFGKALVCAGKFFNCQVDESEPESAGSEFNVPCVSSGYSSIIYYGWGAFFLVFGLGILVEAIRLFGCQCCGSCIKGKTTVKDCLGHCCWYDAGSRKWSFSARQLGWIASGCMEILELGLLVELWKRAQLLSEFMDGGGCSVFSTEYWQSLNFSFPFNDTTDLLEACEKVDFEVCEPEIDDYGNAVCSPRSSASVDTYDQLNRAFLAMLIIKLGYLVLPPLLALIVKLFGKCICPTAKLPTWSILSWSPLHNIHLGLLLGAYESRNEYGVFDSAKSRIAAEHCKEMSELVALLALNIPLFVITCIWQSIVEGDKLLTSIGIVVLVITGIKILGAICTSIFFHCTHLVKILSRFLPLQEVSGSASGDDAKDDSAVGDHDHDKHTGVAYVKFEEEGDHDL